MRVAHYLIRGRSGLFYFRLRVPPDLGAAMGLRVIKRATGTRCRRVALAVAVDWAGRFVRAFIALRQGGSPRRQARETSRPCRTLAGCAVGHKKARPPVALTEGRVGVAIADRA